MWWELYVFALYRHLGYSITVLHSDVPGITTPDFLVNSGTAEMYVECTVVFANEGPVTSNPAIEAWIYDCINRVQNRDFLVGLTIEGEGTQQPSAAEITRPLEKWLLSLDPDAVEADLRSAGDQSELSILPEKRFTVRDWTLLFVAFPNPPDKRYEGGRLLGSLPPRAAFMVRNIDRIQDAVKQKGRHYELDKPLVVAVLSVTAFAEQDDVTDAMFGRKVVQHYPGDPTSVRLVRQRNGYWRGPGTDRGTRVSAVLFSQDVRPWSVASHLPAVWINPWAARPITDHPPLTILTAEDNGEIVTRLSATSPHDVFQLSDG